MTHRYVDLRICFFTLPWIDLSIRIESLNIFPVFYGIRVGAIKYGGASRMFCDGQSLTKLKKTLYLSTSQIFKLLIFVMELVLVSSLESSIDHWLTLCRENGRL